MASARLEAMRVTIETARAALNGSLPIIKNYAHLKDAATEFDAVEALVNELGKDAAVVASATQMAVAEPAPTASTPSK